jgi:DNA-binding NarL/FixJ family response regulator
MIETQPTIALVEDDPSLRETVTSMLIQSGNWRITGSFSTAEEALSAIPAAVPQVVLMDIQLPGMSGIDCVSKLKQKCPGVQIMMVTVYDNNDRIYNALAAGADGYLLKRDIPEKLFEALSDLLKGGSPMSSDIARKVVQHFRVAPPAGHKDQNLTPRETQILDLLVNGAISKEIASELGIGVETVSTHLRNIYAKLQVRSRTAAVVKYLGRR